MDAIDAFAKENDAYRIAFVLINSIEDYRKTLCRWWDWGCKNILPKEGYELIRPYLRKGKQK